MEIRVLSKLEEIREIAEDWDRLLERSGVVPLYLNPTWIYNWLKFLGKNDTPFIITGSIEDRLVFVLPLLLRNLLGPYFRILRFSGNPSSDHLGFIMDGEHRREISEGLSAFLKEHKSLWDISDFAEIPEDIFNSSLLSEPNFCINFKAFKVMESSVCPYLDIAREWEEFYRKRKKRKFRYNVERARRKLEDLGTVEFKTLKTWKEIESYLPQIFDVHRKRWKGYYTGSIFSTLSGENFFRMIAKEYITKGWMDLAVLLLDDQVIAYSYSFKWDGRYFYYNPAYDPKYSNYSPGNLLLINILERLFDMGFKRIDFGRGDLSYKYLWSDDVRQNKRVIFASPHIKGKISYFLYLGFLFLREKLRKSAFVRRLLSRLSFWKR